MTDKFKIIITDEKGIVSLEVIDNLTLSTMTITPEQLNQTGINGVMAKQLIGHFKPILRKINKKTK